MRRFLYLDTETLNSYIAQINNGLLDVHTSERETGNKEYQQAEHTIEGSADAGINIFGQGIGAKGSYGYAQQHSSDESSVWRDIETKRLHDDALDSFIRHLDANQLWKDKDYNVGDFVRIDGTVHFTDIDYLLRQFEKGGIIPFQIEHEVEELRAQLEAVDEALSTTKTRKPDKHTNESLAKFRTDTKKKYAEMETVFKLLKSAIPYNRLAICNGFMVAVTDTYFRDKADVVAFKYGGNMKVIGYITNTTEQPHADMNPLMILQPLINIALMKMFESNEVKFILHPIAIYYE